MDTTDLDRFTLRPDLRGTPSLRADGPNDLARDVCAAAVTALLRASARPGWSRLKACRETDCRWVFVDSSRNSSRRWCDMAACGKGRTSTLASYEDQYQTCIGLSRRSVWCQGLGDDGRAVDPATMNADYTDAEPDITPKTRRARTRVEVGRPRRVAITRPMRCGGIGTFRTAVRRFSGRSPAPILLIVTGPWHRRRPGQASLPYGARTVRQRPRTSAHGDLGSRTAFVAVYRCKRHNGAQRLAARTRSLMTFHPESGRSTPPFSQVSRGST